MLRFVCTLFAATTLFAAAAHAERYTDPQGRFTVTVPKDWLAEKPNTAEVALFMAGARDNKLIGLCIGLIVPSPETKGMSQAEMNAILDREVTDDYWQASLKAGSAGEGGAVESTGARDAPGRRVHYAVMTTKVKLKDGTVQEMKGKEEITAIPGAIHDVSCMTDRERYDAASADFEAIFLSYTPTRGLLSQAPQPVGPSVLTLYAGPNFTGTARVLAQDTPNVAALGLDRAAASLAVAGFGQWEACEGANFTGKCRVLTMAETADAGRTLPIGSLRRYNGGARGPAAAISAATGRALHAAIERFRAR